MEKKRQRTACVPEGIQGGGAGRKAGKRVKRPPEGEMYPRSQLEPRVLVCDNLLNRDFHAETAGAKWVSDISYLRVLGGACRLVRAWRFFCARTVA
jgi:transposase InsO family protein